MLRRLTIVTIKNGLQMKYIAYNISWAAIGLDKGKSSENWRRKVTDL